MENQNNTAQVVTDIGLPELRDVLKGACLSGEPITLSHLAAGALYYAMTTGAPQPALPPLALASVLPLSRATDEEMSNLAHYHQGERIVSAFKVTPETTAHAFTMLGIVGIASEQLRAALAHKDARIAELEAIIAAASAAPVTGSAT